MSRALIERLKQRPRHARVQVAFVAAVCTTGLIATLWGAALPARIAALSGEEPTRNGWGITSLFESARGTAAQLIGALPSDDAPPPRETESGTYRAGAPEDATAPGFRYTPGRDDSAVVPAPRRQVQIATTTRE